MNIKKELKNAICNNDTSFLEKHKGMYSINERFEDEDNDTLLLYALSDSGSDAYQFLLESKADITLVNDEGENVIHSIVYSGVKERLYSLLNKDNIDQQSKDGTTPLLLAIVLEKYEIAQVLIKGGADITIPDYEKYSPIHAACGIGGNLPLVIELVNKGADLFKRTSNGNLPLALAVNAGYDDIVKFLYKKIYG